MNRPAGAGVDENIFIASLQPPYPLCLPWFYDQVRNKGPWDYKQQSPLYQSYGNFNYGAAGRAAGIPDYVLRRGAGAAQ
jgi:hypothetical protein